jgi:NAD(P)-dependent dehydrogenase (short-subunit alcohol dehydrogenase family)
MMQRLFVSREEYDSELISTEPPAPLGKPHQIAEAVVWLCSDAASFVTGHALSVDGGMTAQ